jgi:hypothetical protein
MSEVVDFVSSSYDSVVASFDAVPVSSVTDISPTSFSYGSEFIGFDDGSFLQQFEDGSILSGGFDGSLSSIDIQGQVGSFAGDSGFVNLTNPGSIVDGATSTNFGASVFTFDDGSTLTTSASGAISATAAPSYTFETLSARAGFALDDLTKAVSKQFTPANISKTVTDFAVQQGKQIVGQAISQVVPPALQPYASRAVNTAINSATAAPVAGGPGTGNTGFFSSLLGPTTNGPAATAPSGVAYDDEGNLLPGYTTREDGTPVFLGGGFNDATGEYLDKAAPIFDPYYGLSDAQLQALGNADPTDPYIRARLGIPQLPDSPLNTSNAGLTSFPGAVGNIFSSAATAGTDFVKSLFPGAATAPGASNDPAAIAAAAAAAAAASAVRSLLPGTVNDPGLATPPLDSAALAILATLRPGESALINGQFVSAGSPQALALADAASRAQGLLRQAQNQQTARIQANNNSATGDWRVRLQLADSSDYLYNASDCGPLLWPLRDTNGVIFPYTPNIDTAYKANYSTYDLTHSNYRGYFYQNSYIDGINIKATFTAQDTVEANYLLAVIHFFRSVTKMFYGQDAQRGTPPPLVFLSGLGDFQFNKHPCVVSQFNYNLPADVNYIRAQSTLSNGGNQLAARTRQTTRVNTISSTIARLASLGQAIQPGAVTAPFAPQGSLAAGNPTYVPTKMEISLVLLPVQTRSQVSQQFSVKSFANGNLLKGGFW